ncbi:MAG: hypothetical protein NXI09_09695 [Bacteroidetes bacterium]|nr:hypothetical protein [Bacteroidota bacterium]
MTKILFIVLLGLTLSACGQETTFNEEIWLETNSMTIYDSSREKLFTGKLKGQEDGKGFYGNVKNGKPEGMCYWLNLNSDTIQILEFQNGEKILSQQFDQKGNRQGKQWSMEFIEPKNADKELVSTVLKLLLKNRFDSIKSFYQAASSIPELDLIGDKVKRIKEDKGEVQGVEIVNIEKRKYANIAEFHIEAQVVLETEKGSSNYTIRLLTDDKIITSINFWKRENEVSERDFIKPDFYFYLKM